MGYTPTLGWDEAVGNVLKEIRAASGLFGWK